MGHITTECRMMAKKCHKDWTHDKVKQILHWHLSRNLDLEQVVQSRTKTSIRVRGEQDPVGLQDSKR